MYLKKKDVKQAEATLTKGLPVADSPTVRVALGEVYFRQGKIPEAEQEWVNVLNSGKQDARAYMGLARVRWAISVYKSGRSMIDRAHPWDSNDPEIRRLWIRKARPDRAGKVSGREPRAKPATMRKRAPLCSITSNT